MEKAEDVDGIVWHRRKEDEDRFMYGRAGDQFMCPFQCDTCIFRTVYGRDPDQTGSANDQKNLRLIRRVNLDALWSREPTTVSSNLGSIRKGLKIAEKLGVQRLYPQLGPYPMRDEFGYALAMVMAEDSLGPGKYHKSHKQFDTIRGLRSGFSNLHAVSSVSVKHTLRLAPEDHKKATTISRSGAQSEWFRRFMSGCRLRMGQDYRPNLAISKEVLQEIFVVGKRRLRNMSRGTQEHTTMIGALCYFAISWACSLRGNEGFMLCIAGLRRYLRAERPENSNSDPMVIIPLKGRFKGEAGERYHLLVSAEVTGSGVEVGKWLDILLHTRQESGQENGPAFCDQNGNLVATSVYEEILFDVLEEIQQTRSSLIPKDINVREKYGLSRSFRRGATTEAKNADVPDFVVKAINRWRLVETAKGRKPAFDIDDHYAEVMQLAPTQLRFSQRV